MFSLFSLPQEEPTKNCTESTKLLSIKHSKLCNVSDLNEFSDYKVISVVGDARKGKSTLMNILVNFITKSDKEYFKVQSSIEHCTKGIDYLIIDKYLFIDCQGLNYESSAEDAKLLLFVYTISNIIIYNEKGIVNNNFFTTFQPMATYLSSFEDVPFDNKHIIVRISDYDLDDDADDLAPKLFEMQGDQYDNIRKSIHKLFKTKSILSTASLEKSHKKMIKESNYNDLIEDDDTEILTFVETIFELASEQESISINLEYAIDAINNNKNINYKDFDVYTLLLEKKIREYWDNICKSYDWCVEHKQPIPIDGYQSTREALLQLKTEFINLYETFNTKFVKAPEELKNETMTKIHDIIKTLDKFIIKNTKIATDLNIDFFSEESTKIIKYYDGFPTELIEPYNVSVIKFNKKLDEECNINMSVKICNINGNVCGLYNTVLACNTNKVSYIETLLKQQWTQHFIQEKINSLTFDTIKKEYNDFVHNNIPFVLPKDMTFYKIENGKKIEIENKLFEEEILTNITNEFIKDSTKYKKEYDEKIMMILHNNVFLTVEETANIPDCFVFLCCDFFLTRFCMEKSSFIKKMKEYDLPHFLIDKMFKQTGNFIHMESPTNYKTKFWEQIMNTFVTKLLMEEHANECNRLDKFM